MSSDRGTVHIVGAGLAGLAAAVQLVNQGRKIAVHEATGYAGGRCRSFHDKATDMLIDNGTHLLLSGNHAARALVRTVGSEAWLQGPANADFPFVDLANGNRWTLSFGKGLLPWWVFDKSRRVPETRALDYFSLARLLFATTDRPLGEVVNGESVLFERLLSPFLLAALNIRPLKGSTKLTAALIRETLAQGGQACRPLMAQHGIGKVFIEPTLEYLQKRGVTISFMSELISFNDPGGRIDRLEFSDGPVTLGAGDAVILAVPPYIAARIVPDLQAPSSFRPIVNMHYRIDPPESFPLMIGVINGTSDWIFSSPGRMSVTVSDAEQLMQLSREDVARKIWQDVAKVTKLPAELPPWQLVRERRATFAATPEENAKRPGAETKWPNLFLAGDWTATGLPGTIEGAVRSGNRAAGLVTNTRRAAA